VNGSGLVTGVGGGAATIRYIVTGCGPADTASYDVEVNVCNTIVNVKAYIQGYYSGGSMAAVMENSGVSGATSLQADTLTVEIHDGTTGDLIGSAAKAILNTDGTASAVFPALSGSHYIVLKHRSAMETWSAIAVAMSSTVSYDFTTSASQAYGSNQVDLGGGVYGLYNGDVNQDGIIESTDYSIMENDVLQILFGYYVTDLTGDGVVESSDYSLIENNVLQIIFVARPF